MIIDYIPVLIGGSVSERWMVCSCNPGGFKSNPFFPDIASLVLFSFVPPEFNSSVKLANSPLVCLQLNGVHRFVISIICFCLYLWSTIQTTGYQHLCDPYIRSFSFPCSETKAVGKSDGPIQYSCFRLFRLYAHILYCLKSLFQTYARLFYMLT